MFQGCFSQILLSPLNYLNASPHHLLPSAGRAGTYIHPTSEGRHSVTALPSLLLDGPTCWFRMLPMPSVVAAGAQDNMTMPCKPAEMEPSWAPPSASPRTRFPSFWYRN